MAEGRDNRVTAGISVAAAIAAALAWINSRKALAAPGGDLPEEFIELIVAIAGSSGRIDDSVQQVIQELSTLAINVQGWPPNAESLAALRVAIAVTGTRLPSITIPDGMSLVIKAWSLNPGDLQVGASISACTNINQSFPLLPNEVVGYQMQDADQIYMAATVAGCFASLTVEQRRGGGG